jgi:FSR family fosmidomycin resistance protein-like MFS transporter
MGSLEERRQRRAIGLLSTGHLCTDIAQGALPALLPFLIYAHGLKFAQAGGLMFAMSAGSSVVQPVFGYFADRLAKPWLMSLGLLFAGLGIALAGLAANYWAIVLAVAICGFGVAAFHPEGTRQANHAAGPHKATAMSIFSFGGNAGFALGPLLVAGVYMLCGLPGTVFLGLPPLVMAVILLSQQRQFSALPSEHLLTTAAMDTPAVRDAWGAFSWLSLLVIVRSIIFYGIMTFLPLFWIQVLGQSKEAGSAMLTVFFGVGAVGTLLGGRLAERLGYRQLVTWGFVLLLPLLCIWPHCTSVLLASVLLVPLAISYYAPFSAIVVLGQQYLPNRVGFASGVTLGLAVSIGGVTAPFLGHWADLHGVQSALLCVALLPILCILISVILPAPPQPRKRNDAPQRALR